MSDSENVEYLQPGFDPASLTVPRLRSILVTYNVQYPSTAKKTQLIELFNDHIVPQSKKILAQRARAKRSSMGIVDADSQSTQSNEDQDLMPPPSARRARSPRKSTRVKSESVEPEYEPELPRPVRESPRKRQSRSASAQAPTASDTDSTDLDAGRNARKTPRRVTPSVVKLEPPEEEEHFFRRTPETEGVFTDDNPFQSGGSSPPAPVRTPSNRRKTTGSEVAKAKTSTAPRRRTDGPLVDDEGYHVSKSIEIPVKPPSRAKTPVVEDLEPTEEFTPEEQLELTQEEAAHPNRAVVARRKPKSSFNLTTPLSVILVTLLGAYAAWYRQEKVAVGYCGVGRPAKDLTLANVELPEWASSLVPQNAEIPDWATPLIEPECEPCPQHAYCYSDFSVRCESDFILKPHPLSLGGLVPLPPTCEPDGEKVRRVQAVADKAVEELRERRAKFECQEPINEQGDIPETPAIEVEELKETISRKRSKRMTLDEFDDLWVAAIGEVKARDEIEVIEPEPEPETGDSRHLQNERILSTSLARLPLTCALKRSALQGLARYRGHAAVSALVALLAAWARARFRASRAVAAQVPGLVDRVLERLGQQKELAFDSDGDEDAFLFVPNLRDDVLRQHHSLAQRERIWSRVRAVVEQNSNVRVGQREGHNGEVGLAWEWIGPSPAGLLEAGGGGGTYSGHRRRKSGRVSFGPDVKAEDGGAAVAAPEMGENRNAIHRKWEESRPIY